MEIISIITLILCLIIYLIYRKTKNYISWKGASIFVIFIIIFLITLSSFGATKLGIRFDNFLEAGIPTLIFTIIGVIILFTIGKHKSKTRLRLLTLYLIFGITQQLFFQSIFHLTIFSLVNIKAVSIILTAIFVSLFHIDKNKTLFCLTLVSALVWSTIFLYYPNILILGISHAILAYLYYTKIYKRKYPKR